MKSKMFLPNSMFIKKADIFFKHEIVFTFFGSMLKIRSSCFKFSRKLGHVE